MFKMTASDLALKTDRQLAALFQDASKGIAASSRDLASAQSLLAMIQSEQARRKPSP